MILSAMTDSDVLCLAISNGITDDYVLINSGSTDIIL